jgi:hypothetical protein
MAWMIQGLWSNSKVTWMSSGQAALNLGKFCFTNSTTLSVEASLRFVTGMYTVRLPFTMAMLVMRSLPSLTSPMSRTYTAPLSVTFSGTAARSWMFFTTAFVGTMGKLLGSARLPLGLIVLASVIALTTSSGDSP